MRKLIGFTGAAALLMAGSLVAGPSASADEIIPSEDGNGYIYVWDDEPEATPTDTVVESDTEMSDDVEVAGTTVSSDDLVIPSPDGNGFIVIWGGAAEADQPAAVTSAGASTSMPDEGVGDAVMSDGPEIGGDFEVTIE